jgi:NADH-quinone oxidoreductase subunit C
MSGDEPGAPPIPPEPAPPGDGDEDPLVLELRHELGPAIEQARSGAGDGIVTVAVRREEIARVAAALLHRFRYTVLVDLCGADYPGREPRFQVVYHLYSFRENRRLRLVVAAGEDQPVPSVAGVWRGADWLEREVWDMFGVAFSGRPELSRLLLWDGFQGHPLRKDFPLSGLDTGAALYPEYEEPGPVADR